MLIKHTFLAPLVAILCAAGPVSGRQSRVRPTYEDTGASRSDCEDEIIPPTGVDYIKWPPSANYLPWAKRSVSGEKTEVEILYEQPLSAEIVYGAETVHAPALMEHSIPKEDTEEVVLREQPVSADIVYGEEIVPGPALTKRHISEEATENEVSHTSPDIAETTHGAENGPILQKRGFDFRKYYCSPRNPWKIWVGLWIGLCYDYDPYADDPLKPDPQFNLMDETEFGIWGPLEGTWDFGVYPDWSTVERPGVKKAGFHGDGVVAKQARGKRSLKRREMRRAARSRAHPTKPEAPESPISAQVTETEVTETAAESSSILSKRGFKMIWCNKYNPYRIIFIDYWIVCGDRTHHPVRHDPDAQFNLFNQTEFGIWEVEEMDDAAYETVEMPPGGEIAWDWRLEGQYFPYPASGYEEKTREELARLANLSSEDLEKEVEKEPNHGRDWLGPSVPKSKPQGEHRGSRGDEDEVEDGAWKGPSVPKPKPSNHGKHRRSYAVDGNDGDAWQGPSVPKPKPNHEIGLYQRPKSDKKSKCAMPKEPHTPKDLQDAPTDEDSSTSKAALVRREEHPYGLLAKCIFTLFFKCRRHPGDKWFPNHDGTTPAQTGVNDYKDEGGACNGGNWADGCCTKDQWGCPRQN